MAGKTAGGLTDGQLSDCIAEYALSQQLWVKNDREIAETKSHELLRFATAGLDGQQAHGSKTSIVMVVLAAPPNRRPVLVPFMRIAPLLAPTRTE
jgi:hypothetical protein